MKMKGARHLCLKDTGRWQCETRQQGKGHRGIMVLVREKEGHLIQLEKEDSNKQFIWFKISENGNHIRIAACYFAPQV